MKKFALAFFSLIALGGVVACGKQEKKSFDSNDKTVIVEIQENEGEMVLQFMANGTYAADADMPISGAWICNAKDGFAADDCEYDKESKTATFSWYNGMFSPSVTFDDKQLKILTEYGGNPDGLRKGDWGPAPEEA